MNADETRSTLRTSLVAFFAVLALLVGAYFFGVNQSSRGILSTLKEQDAKEHLVAAMLVNLQAASEAEKSAVMAETDEASQTNAAEAQQKSAAVEADRRELSGLIEGNGQAEDEQQLLNEFNTAWAAYQDLDREILALAVENTNLKAVKLSLGPAAEALARFDAALQQLAATAGATPDGAQAAQAAFQAVVAAHNIHTLQGPHIAESSDAEMDRIEGEMTELDKQVSASLETLANLPGAEQQAELAQAQAAYQEFQKVQTQILELSRRNSNVRSLTLSLGKKRLATASCTETLTALQKSIRNEKSPATRW
ncbi:MCP four helix bundle domain-containing protein [Lacipirellula limnantheis]|uniref:Four helix bundle sensory module for signal transduction n=1 Tax=Lacipirellula limnantheis TaxID=2528024 RepID=A0A517U2B5_9BACT|nr:MCP four helix bundle domain-containing protein [Lacipirellula limnantheis]QDT74768.1 Four helix bundle sensory module for signal transduction [Lacipirellula limnantheis]